MLWALPKPKYTATGNKSIGPSVIWVTSVKSTTCMPWAGASLTMKAWLSKTLTSRHKLCTEAVGTLAK